MREPLGHPAARALGIGALLARPRFELVPLKSAEPEADHLPAGSTVAITCSPRRGVDATVGLAERLAARGFRPAPHVAARLVRSGGHLEDLAGRLVAAGVEDVFVVGGDPPQAIGPYDSALDLLEALTERGRRFRQVGIAGYPERHPSIAAGALERALVSKQAMASYVVTQICFDPTAIFRWVTRIRGLGVALPVHIGMPGAVTRRRLLEIALRIGVGDSIRYLTRHGSLVARLVRRGSYRPDAFLARLAPYLAEGGHLVAGVHINTFNQVRSTERWRHRALATYGWTELTRDEEGA